MSQFFFCKSLFRSIRNLSNQTSSCKTAVHQIQLLLALIVGVKILTTNPLIAADILSITGTSVPSIAYAVSADGRTVVGANLSATGGAFKYTVGGALTYLPKLGSPTGWERAFDVSSDGKMVVGVSGDYSAVWTDSVITSLGIGEAYGVSADGSIVVGMSNSNAFRWTSATGMVNIGIGVAFDISGDGSVIVGQQFINSTYQACYWKATTGINLINTNGLPSRANSISPNGEYISGEIQGTNNSGFVFSQNQGIRYLNVAANAVSNDGKIVVGKTATRTAGFWNGYNNSTSDLFAYLKGINLSGINNWVSFENIYDIKGDNINGYSIVGFGKLNSTNLSPRNAFVIRGLTFPVPEPSTYLLGLLSVIAIVMTAKKAKSIVQNQLE